MALPVRLDHCVIHVSDWDASNAFYHSQQAVIALAMLSLADLCPQLPR